MPALTCLLLGILRIATGLHGTARGAARLPARLRTRSEEHRGDGFSTSETSRALLSGGLPMLGW